MNDSLVFKHTPPLDDDFIPDVLKARESHIADVSKALRSFLEDGLPLHVLLYGRSGTGKTAIARHVLKHIAEQTPVRTAYVNCWELRTLYGVADALRLQLKVMFAEKAETVHKMERIRKVLADKKLVLVLDEIDRVVPMERDNILYQFLSWGNVALVCVANSRDFLMDLEQRVLSRFTPVHVECPPYEPDDVFQVLAERAELSLKRESYDEALLRQIAVGAEGDARLAISILRQAAQLSDANRSPAIREQEISRAFGDMKLLRRKHLLDKLTPHHRTIVDIIEQQPGLHSLALREAYEVECQKQNREPVAHRTFGSYVERLIQLKLVKSEPKPGDGTARVFFLT